MTDARFPERWLNDRRVLRLSDPAFRLFVISLTWSVSNRTYGELYDDDDDLLLIPRVDLAAASPRREYHQPACPGSGHGRSWSPTAPATLTAGPGVQCGYATQLRDHPVESHQMLDEHLPGQDSYAIIRAAELSRI